MTRGAACLISLLLLLLSCRQPAPPPPPPQPTATPTRQPLVATRLPSPTPTATATAVPLTISLSSEAPVTVAPGAVFNLLLRVQNPNERDLSALQIVQPVPQTIGVQQLPDGAELHNGAIVWHIDTLRAGATATNVFFLEAPVVPQQLMLPPARASTPTIAAVTAQPLSLQVEGRFPIAVAHAIAADLDGQPVGVSGMVTAILTDTFYLTDSSASLRVMADDKSLSVQLGDAVAVDGILSVNNAELQLKAAAVTAAAAESGEPPPQPLALDSPLGSSVTISATLSQQLTGPHLTQLVLQRDNGAQHWALLPTDQAHGLQIGAKYEIKAVTDRIDGRPWLIIGRRANLTPLYPEGLRIAVTAPLMAPLRQLITHTITVNNDAGLAAENIILSLAAPNSDAATINGISGNGNLGSDGIIYWGIPQLAAGVSVTLQFSATYTTAAVASYAAEIRQSDLPISGEQALTLYAGRNVPIAAIQGDAIGSPFTGRFVRSEGVVTTVSAVPRGFYLQQVEQPDRRGSHALFVAVSPATPLPESGSYLLVSGTVRELAGQSTIVAAADGVDAVGFGPLPPPQVLPPAATPAEFELREGMLISVPTTIVVGLAPKADRAYVTLVGATQPQPWLIDLSSQRLNIKIGDHISPFGAILSESYGRYILVPVTPLSLESDT